MRLLNRIAWVTGAAQGLGEAIAHRFAREGCVGLALCDIQTEKLNAVAGAIRREHPQCGVLPLCCDVREEAQVVHTAQQIAQHFGRLDILVANAGVIHSAEITEMTLEQWQYQIDVNLT
ncbi:MAG: SDR family NAD(P)-dependent oxidoreductase, partial [Fimbriimonadales bacterium]|nr:SDR family NAD(P)-dependent oxidoreductase [Fimbriimonadales bacterium]